MDAPSSGGAAGLGAGGITGTGAGTLPGFATGGTEGNGAGIGGRGFGTSGGTAGGGATVVQALATASAAIAAARHAACHRLECLSMGWIILESLVALALFVFIVWWTMRGPRKRDAAADRGRRSPGDRPTPPS